MSNQFPISHPNTSTEEKKVFFQSNRTKKMHIPKVVLLLASMFVIVLGAPHVSVLAFSSSTLHISDHHLVPFSRTRRLENLCVI